jgi:Ser/Thr protein kinase RdoA (MazF antagonist)
MSDLFAAIAQQALKAYGLGGAPYIFIQHSENVTFKVESPQGARLLRIHVPRSWLMGRHGVNLAMVHSEMLWLEALRRETDLPVQQPMRNLDAQFVTRIVQGRRTFNCTMLEWLDGEPYRYELENEESAAQLGATIGKLHQFSQRWQTPNGFVRPRRDGRYFRKALERLRQTTEDGRASYRDFKNLETAIETLTKITARKKGQILGLVHGDLYKGNFLYHQGQIRLIDFSMSGIGNYLFDLGMCFSDMNPALHPIFLEQYQKLMPLPRDYARLIEGFFLAGMVMTFSFSLRIPEAQEELVYRISLIGREYAAKFNRDERFWFPV